MIKLNTNKELVSTVQALLDLDAQIDEAEAHWKVLKEKARTLREETIPNAMTELGLTSLTLENGQALSIKQEVYASISASQAPLAFDWLNENGFGGLIKTEVTTLYGKGERDAAQKLVAKLTNEGLNANFKESVHPSTLKAFLKEQIAEGNPCPLDLFGARPVMTTKIK